MDLLPKLRRNLAVAEVGKKLKEGSGRETFKNLLKYFWRKKKLVTLVKFWDWPALSNATTFTVHCLRLHLGLPRDQRQALTSQTWTVQPELERWDQIRLMGWLPSFRKNTGVRIKHLNLKKQEYFLRGDSKVFLKKSLVSIFYPFHWVFLYFPSVVQGGIVFRVPWVAFAWDESASLSLKKLLHATHHQEHQKNIMM